MGTLLSRRDLLAAGYTDAEVRAALRRRELTRVATGIYAPTSEFEAMDPDNRYRSRVRAIAERSPDLVISHLSAAALHGLPLPAGRRMPVHLTRPGRGVPTDATRGVGCMQRSSTALTPPSLVTGSR